MLGKAIQPEIESMIQTGQFDELRELLSEDLNAADIAEILEDLGDEDEAVLFRLLPTSLAFEVFELLEYESQENLIEKLSRERVTLILNEMSPDDRTELLQELPGEIAQRMLKTLNPEELLITRRLLGYPEESIGRLMTPEYIAVNPTWTVAQTIDYIRENARKVETINVIYVLSDRGHLIDDLQLGQLLLAQPDTLIETLCDEQFVALSAYEDQEEAIDAFKKYDRVALPVTDSRGVMVGIVTVDDIFDVAEEEETEDVQKFGGQEALEDPYFATPIFELLRKRVGWLALLLVSSSLTVMVMDYFKDRSNYLYLLPFLPLFVPMIISSGGNSGSQSAALIIRGFAVKEITLPNWWRVLSRELMIGLMLGLTLGGLAAVFSYHFEKRDRFEMEQVEQGATTPAEKLTAQAPAAAVAAAENLAAEQAPPQRLRYRFPLLVLISITMVVTLGTIVGSMLPFFFKGIGFDPAVCSGPFIATFVDVLGTTLYFLLFMWLYHSL